MLRYDRQLTISVSDRADRLLVIDAYATTHIQHTYNTYTTHIQHISIETTEWPGCRVDVSVSDRADRLLVIDAYATTQ